MPDLNDNAYRHFIAIRAELAKATRTLSPDAFCALIHETHERVQDLYLDLCHRPFPTSATALAKAWPEHLEADTPEPAALNEAASRLASSWNIAG